jgi:hypothetical protein
MNPSPGFAIRARMPSEGLRVAFEGSSIGPWERPLSPDSA